ncbi:Ig-like domain-containing protein, partial [Aquabacterium sp.]|uniref:Ig-like domain-containing protein n=1 Tax=Aquabacterium sp. TaxID=1872578 RepID=UPI0024870A98
MPILSQSAGTVVAVWGKAFYHLPNGKLVPVKVGDHIEGGEAILTSQDGIVKITSDDGPTVLLKAKLAAADTDKVITGLNNDELDFNTAAGLQGGGSGGLLPGLRVDRVSEAVTGQEYQYSTERGAPTAPLASAEQPLYPAAEDTTPPAILTAQLDPSSDSGTKGDGITNDATPTISGTGDPGAQIKVTMPGTNEVLTTTVLPNGTWTVTPTQNIPNGTTGLVQVTETDAAGNATQTTVPLSIDTSVPNNGAAPTVTITEDANNDGFINKAELTGNVDVKVAFTPAQVSVGDVVKVTSGGVTNEVSITAQNKANGFVATSFTAPANGTTMTVISHIEDAAGNRSATGSDTAKLDLSTLTGLSISLTTDANDDGFINQSELAGAQTADARVKLPSDAVAGDLLTVTSTGSAPQTITLTQSHIDAGQVQVSVVALASGTDLVVTAQVSDAAGNQSAVVSDHAVIATDDILAPKVTIGEDANDDGYINKVELNGNIDVSVALPATAKAGDSLLVSANGAAQTPIVLTQADIDKGSVSVPGITNPGEGSTLTVTAQVKDVAGNLGATGTDSAVIDTTPPSVLTAQLDPASDSGTKGDGITNDATPTISGTGDPGAQIKVTMPGTGEVLTTTVLPNGTWTVTPTQDIPNGTTGQAQVTETDAAGNTTQTTVPLNIDTGVPNNGAAPTVTITEDANNDGFINKAELNGNVDVKVAFTPAQVSVGDVVKITSGGVTNDIVITAQDRANGFVNTTFTAPANGTTMTVNSHIEDSAGNVSATGSDAAKLDLSTLTGLSISLSTDANDDGFINQVELAGGSQVTAQVKLPVDAAAGDALSITATGNAPQTIVLTQAQIDAGQVQISLTAPTSGTDLVATAQVSDAAGNQSAVVSDHAIIATDDILAPKVTITTDANNDGYINQAEQGASSAIGVQIDLPGTAKAGDSLLVSINGANQAPIVLTQADIDNHSVAIPGVTSPGDGGTLTVTAQFKDVAGNLGATGTDSAKIDTTSYTGLGISITTDGNNDGYISKAELTDNTIGVRVTLPAGAAAGDTLSVTGSGNVAQVITLSAAQLSAGFVDLKFNPTADNTDFVSTASIVDAAGNSAGPVIDAARLQLGVPGAPIVTIGEDSNNDGFINKAELSGNIDVSVALPATAKAGDSLLVSANGAAQTPIVLTQADIDKGSVSVPGITNPGEGSTLTVTAQVKDVAGNLGATGTDSAIIDTTPPAILTAQLDPASDSGTKGDGITNDATPTISGTGDPGAQIKVTMPGTGEVLTTTVLPNGTWTVTPTQDIPNGTTGQAQVTETDAAGNTTQTTVPLNIDTGVPNNGAAPTVTITEDANNDGFINKAELNGNVDVKVAFTSAQVNIGDVVKVTSGGVTNDVTITAQDKANGFVSTSFTPAAEGTTMTVTALIVDTAGNSSAPGTDSARIDTTNYTGLGIAITTDGNNDGYISKAELTDNTIGVRVTLPAGAAAGDTLSVTGSGNVAQVITLSAAQLSAGFVDLKFNPTADNTDFVSTASIVDAAGNSAGPVIDAARLQLGVPGAPIVTIGEDSNNDGFINKAELSGNIDVSVALPATAKAGDSLLVSANGAAQAPILLTQADIDKGSVSVPGITNPGEGSTLTVTAQVKDVAGNLGATGTDSAIIDTTPPSVLTAQLDPASDSGTKGDGITNDATPTI